eukprot:4372180-Pleurochrysis_carterae.AAC.1
MRDSRSLIPSSSSTRDAYGADQQVRRDRDPLLAKNDEILSAVPRYPGGVEYADRAYFSWEPAA